MKAKEQDIENIIDDFLSFFFFFFNKREFLKKEKNLKASR